MKQNDLIFLVFRGNVWTEYIASVAHVQHMLLPRLAALAEVGWSYDRRDLEDFRRRMDIFRHLYELNGYRYAPYFFTPAKQAE